MMGRMTGMGSRGRIGRGLSGDSNGTEGMEIRSGSRLMQRQIFWHLISFIDTWFWRLSGGRM